MPGGRTSPAQPSQVRTCKSFLWEGRDRGGGTLWGIMPSPILMREPGRWGHAWWADFACPAEPSSDVQKFPLGVQFYPGKVSACRSTPSPIRMAANVPEQKWFVGRRQHELGPNRRQVEAVPRLWPRALGKTHR